MVDYNRKNIEGDLKLYRGYIGCIEEHIKREIDTHIKGNMRMALDGLANVIKLKEEELKHLGGRK